MTAFIGFAPSPTFEEIHPLKQNQPDVAVELVFEVKSAGDTAFCCAQNVMTPG
ncbi:hypothetical protein ACO0LO_11670 [Undibacterium sp. TJN25]